MNAERSPGPRSMAKTSDQDDIQLFNELDLSDLAAPKQKWFRKIYKLFEDKS
jgi:hypothetical protein